MPSGEPYRAKMTEITSTLVTQLICTQFPQWAELPVTPVEDGGCDNRTFRLGDKMAVRLPSALSYVAQVEKEHRWLPVLRPHLPLKAFEEEMREHHDRDQSSPIGTKEAS
jgi:aminoglycoside phosphotransferase (APT) family kinase protein